MASFTHSEISDKRRKQALWLLQTIAPATNGISVEDITKLKQNVFRHSPTIGKTIEWVLKRMYSVTDGRVNYRYARGLNGAYQNLWMIRSSDDKDQLQQAIDRINSLTKISSVGGRSSKRVKTALPEPDMSKLLITSVDGSAYIFRQNGKYGIASDSMLEKIIVEPGFSLFKLLFGYQSLHKLALLKQAGMFQPQEEKE